MHVGMTCPMLRQHGARDHTCPWFYGPETEKIIEDIIKLRHAMKPYYTAELNKLNETGRPFNRPLMWDFPVRRRPGFVVLHGSQQSPIICHENEQLTQNIRVRNLVIAVVNRRTAQRGSLRRMASVSACHQWILCCNSYRGCTFGRN
jgi:hypothetical protein